MILPVEKRPSVLIFANPYGLALSLTEEFLSNYLRVFIVTYKKSEWERKLSYLLENEAVSILTPDELDKNFTPTYLVFVSDLIETNKEDLKLKNLAIKSAKKFKRKTLWVLSFSKNEDNFIKKENLLKEGLLDYLGVVYVQDIFGPRVNLCEEDLFSFIFKNAILFKRIILPKDSGYYFFPTFVKRLSKQLVRLLFSFGGVGDEKIVRGPKLSPADFFATFKKVYPLSSTYSQHVLLRRNTKSGIKVITVGFEKEELAATIDWYLGNPLYLKPILAKRGFDLEGIKKELEHTFLLVRRLLGWISPLKLEGIKFVKLKGFLRTYFLKKVSKSLFLFSKLKGKRSTLQKIKLTLLFRILLAIFSLLLIFNPYLFVLVGGWTLNKALSEAFYSGNVKSSRRYMNISEKLFFVGKKEAEIFSGLPFLGNYFQDVYELGELGLDGVEIGKRVYSSFIYLKDIFQGFFLQAENVSPLDLDNKVVSLSAELDSIYRDLSFFEGKIKDKKYFKETYFKDIFQIDDVERVRKKILSLRSAIVNLPDLLGFNNRKKYVVLFQNNMELRPTGGFIGSFAILDIEKGQIKEINVFDVYSADGQLKGHIEPPAPIKRYLNEANWFLRDSNWDPDFPISAKTAEWFLEKEIGEVFDGVIAIDLEFAKDLISLLGKVYLPDYEREITVDNFYEIVQFEVEKDFFPGSKKKSNFLSSLSKSLILDLEREAKNKSLLILKVLFENLEKKHIQIFVHNSKAQRAIEGLGWAGSLNIPECQTNCYPDFVFLVEANVGVNKANYFISRKVNLDVSLKGGKVERKMQVNFKNLGHPAMGDRARYKTYVRVVAPHSSDFGDVLVKKGVDVQSFKPEIEEVKGRKEAGVYLEVPPQQEVEVVFEWVGELPISFTQRGEYKLNVIKQSGIRDIDLSLRFFVPRGINISFSPVFSLTREGVYIYNSILSRDLETRVFW